MGPPPIFTPAFLTAAVSFILSGNAAGAMGFGYLVHALGYGPMFGLLAALLAGACVLAFRLDR